MNNYLNAKETLRYDGDYINHFSSLLNGYYNKEIKFDEIKYIRKFIKDKTSRMSSFRGDMLYILSFLISVMNENIDKVKLIDEIMDVFDLLLEENLKECGYLVLSAYSIVKYVDKENRQDIIYKTKEIFKIIKSKYGNVTKEDDYLFCTLLAINCNEFNSITEYMEQVFNYVLDLDLFSNNSVQGLTNTIMLNGYEDATCKAEELLKALEKNDYKISNHFLNVLGVLVKKQDVDEIISNMKEVVEYLCDEELEYEFYIDKGFRNMLVLVIVFMSMEDENIKYLDELLAFSTYSFLISKNQGVFNEVLA
ncbi:DUF4003 domain-containing protein [Clostridium botulinum]|uniref:Uncharacterized protein n=1 Tax=Clostridium botulinum TaxID=1491 RepID=A0A059PY46_CLOBO|nr:hypothetical protein [Clostridium botulinum]AIY80094.1 hypothetical protein U728_3344 [Clostridium botulinum 202F]KAI3348262.1 DUF4003 domain-containing protein [Clostridium botulinum]KFX57948.1 hypothetical protein KU40_02530 [Clostridium botulinum]KFX58838.1 hypothetical protein KU41_06410 [Clostridium botulinum]